MYAKLRNEEPPYDERVLDLGEDGHDFDLFRSHPYFLDVLEWLAGKKDASQIRHPFSAQDWERRALPACLEHLRKVNLVRRRGTHYVPLHRHILVRECSEDPLSVCERIATHTDTFLERALTARCAADFSVVRTRVSRKFLEDWQMRLSDLLEEMQLAHDPFGVSYSAHIMTLQGA